MFGVYLGRKRRIEAPRNSVMIALNLRSGFRVQGSGFMVRGARSRVQGVGFKFRVQGLGFRLQGLSFFFLNLGC